MYFANPTGAAVSYMVDGTLGWIDTPRQGNARPYGVTWCADNGCFNDATFDEGYWFQWLQNQQDIEHCVFATAPDVLGDHWATVRRASPWLSRIREFGYPAAFVAQDGATPDGMPWTEFDVLFVGGSTPFKLGPPAATLISEAKARGMWVHVGRVNSMKRLIAMDALGADSVDGTYLVFGPDINLPNLLHWVKTVDTQRPLFERLP